MRWLVLALVTILGCGCVSSPTTAPNTATAPGAIVLSEIDRVTIEAAVRAYKPDLPATSTFRTMAARRAKDGIVTACGYVDAGTGDEPYVGLLADGAFTVNALGGTQDEIIAIQSQCGKKGIHI